jgi:hypothetical protein
MVGDWNGSVNENPYEPPEGGVSIQSNHAQRSVPRPHRIALLVVTVFLLGGLGAIVVPMVRGPLGAVAGHVAEAVIYAILPAWAYWLVVHCGGAPKSVR